MTLKLPLAVLALALLPGAALAQCFGDHAKEEIVMSCADGTEYDEDSARCVPLNTS